MQLYNSKLLSFGVHRSVDAPSAICEEEGEEHAEEEDSEGGGACDGEIECVSDGHTRSDGRRLRAFVEEGRPPSAVEECEQLCIL